MSNSAVSSTLRPQISHLPGADDDSGMKDICTLMQTHKVEPVQSQKYPLKRGSEAEDLIIQHGPIRVARPVRRQDIMTESPRLHQQPDRDPRPYDARLTATDIGAGVDAVEVVAEILHHPLQDLRLLTAGKRRLAPVPPARPWLTGSRATYPMGFDRY